MYGDGLLLAYALVGILGFILGSIACRMKTKARKAKMLNNIYDTYDPMEPVSWISESSLEDSDTYIVAFEEGLRHITLTLCHYEDSSEIASTHLGYDECVELLRSLQDMSPYANIFVTRTGTLRLTLTHTSGDATSRSITLRATHGKRSDLKVANLDIMSHGNATDYVKLKFILSTVLHRVALLES